MKSFQANPMSVNDLFSGHEFIVPEFQRPYSWDSDECDKLWDDLAYFYESNPSNNSTYFLGNLVVYPHPKSKTDTWDIIDGQQRLTTLMMLMRALLEKAGTTEFSFLENRVHKTDRNTDKVLKDKIRLVSNVLPEPRSDYDDLKDIIINGSTSTLKNSNRFKSNYDGILEHLTDWWNKNTAKSREKFIFFLRDRVMLLPILCESQDDALALFETINDRGKPLDQSDIFKARIYQAITSPKEKSQFIKRWNNMEDHVDLFLVYMYVLKAKEKSSKRSKLKSYIIDNCLKDKNALRRGWKSLMEYLELYHHYSSYDDWANDEAFTAKENVYWTILDAYPNDNWKYPLFVFMHKHASLRKDDLILSAGKRKEYLELLISSVRFFFIKGLVHNSIDAVRNSSHKLAVQIMEGKSHVTYAPEITAEELKQFQQKLKESLSYGRYTKGLVFLNSFLNPRQQNKAKNISDYADAISGKIHVEHILPKDWCNYDQWDENSHKENIERLGNLMPLEQKKNITASHSFFAKKQKIYEGSKIEDARALSKKVPRFWYLKDLEARHKETVERLMGFFKS